MKLELDLAAEDIAEGFLNMRHDDLIELICAIDLRIAETDFTEELIKRLTTSIRGDYEEGQYAELLAELAWDKA